MGSAGGEQLGAAWGLGRGQPRRWVLSGEATCCLHSAEAVHCLWEAAGSTPTVYTVPPD